MADLNAISKLPLRGRPITAGTALAVLRSGNGDLPAIMAAATAVRMRYFGNTAHLCSIVNAKSGACPEDCVFCAQSVHHKTGCRIYRLISPSALLGAHAAASRTPAGRFGVVTSGPTVSGRDLERICETVSRRKTGPSWCASLGSLDAGQFRKLRAAGVRRYHHNLETAESFFPEICTTHAYAERLATIRLAKKAGMQVCSGGILGMGETPAQRVELALALNSEKVDSIPLNFLMPIKGTPLGRLKPMRPLDMLRSVAMFRLTNPAAEIKVCAGRQHLGSLQSMIFYAGATGMMIGSLLTLPGCDMEADLRMIRDLDMKAVME